MVVVILKRRNEENECSFVFVLEEQKIELEMPVFCVWGTLNDDYLTEKTPLYCISYIIFSLGYVRV